MLKKVLKKGLFSVNLKKFDVDEGRVINIELSS